MSARRGMNIFVHRASECLTDHEAHGDGLICFSLLNGLAERGHQVYAYADTAAISACSPNLHVRTGQSQSLAHSLAPWEQAGRADRWMQELAQRQAIDLVWRMHPYGGGCPAVPQTGGRPLVVGPLFYSWPEQPGKAPRSGRPRFGAGLQGIVGPAAERGWQRTMSQAALILCATGAHAEVVQRQHPDTEVRALPVIVEPPFGLADQKGRGNAGTGDEKRVTLLFTANLVANKNPQIFCETVRLLRLAGRDARGIVLGDGPERPALEAFCASNGIAEAVQFRGKVANSEVYDYMSKADFLVSTSFGEPYGRSIAEAMSVGTPAICHRSGGPADFICDGQDGLLVDELTAAAYASRLEAALCEESCWDRLSAGVRQTARQWLAECVLDTLEQLLQDVAQMQRGAINKEDFGSWREGL